jgi:GAF domain-containing protein
MSGLDHDEVATNATECPATHEPALSHIATLVAEGAGPDELFAAVALEVGRVLDLPYVTLGRYGPDRTLTVLAAPTTPNVDVGSSWRLNDPMLAAQVFDTGRPARIDDYATVEPLAQVARDTATRSAVGVPVILDGVVWGLMAAGSPDERLPADTEQRLEGFTELVTVAISHAEAQDRLRRLADEGAAVRRIAGLVAHGTPSTELCAAVVREVVQLLGVSGGLLLRYEGSHAVTALAAIDFTGLEIGHRYPLDGPSLATEILKTGRPALIDDYSDLDGTIAATVRAAGFRSAFGVPITVDGGLWGLIGIGTDRAEQLPPDAAERLRDLTELLGSGISNAETSERLRRLAERQAALRRVATLVAEGTSPADLVGAVVTEIQLVVEGQGVAMFRYDPDRTATVVAVQDDATSGPSRTPYEFTVGSQWRLDGPSVAATVLDTGRAARVDDYTKLPGAVAAAARQSGLRATVGVPILVDGRLWGVIIVTALDDEPLPPDLDDRLRDFAELVAIAISNAEARARRKRLTEVQSGLRRVATLAAADAARDEQFAAVAEEVVRIADVSAVTVSRFDQDRDAVVVASFNDPGFPVGSRWSFDSGSLQAIVLETGRPARIDDYAPVAGAAAEAARASGIRSAVAAPIIVDGRVWGMVAAGRRQRPGGLPRFAGSYSGRIVLSAEPTRETEAVLGAFAELSAITVAKAQAREDLRRLAEEQAALRRVATRVAEGATPTEIFTAVVDEIASVLGLQSIEMARYEPDGTATVIGASGDHPFPPGSSWTLDGPSVTASVFRTRRPARIDDYSNLSGTIAETVRGAGFRSAIGAPIVVDGATWGMILALSSQAEPIPEQSEIRLSQFTELMATAVSNATARADLVASRARIVAAGDEARRRFERDLHDGTQQRLLAIGLDLQRVRGELDEQEEGARAALERAERDLGAALDEVREVSRGLHPAQLSRGGLQTALRALARRSPIPVTLHVDIAERPPEPIETAAYYVVSEAIANAIKHSRATAIVVTVTRAGGTLHATIADDGVGGAVVDGGSGLTGLNDRVEAVGGRFAIASPRGRGTTISIDLPSTAPTEP